MDVAAWYQRTIVHGETSNLQPKTFDRRGCVLIKNASEVDLTTGDIVTISGSCYDPTSSDERELYRSEPIFVGTKPAWPENIGLFGILQEPIPGVEESGIGWAAINGVVSCTVDIQNQGHHYADIKDDETGKLESRTFGGAELLDFEGKNDSAEDWTAGDKLAWVRIGAFHNPILRFKLTEALTAGSHATATRSFQNAMGEWSDGTSPKDDEEVYADMFYSGSVVINSYVLAQHNRESGLLNLLQGPCAVT